MENNITVVILNWLRPNNIYHKILPELVKCKDVTEIIISHGREDTYFKSPKCNVRIIDRKDFIKNKTFGLSLRFIASLSATNRHILFLDDDIIPLKNTISNLKKYYLKNYPCLVGKFGRKIGSNLQYDYRELEGEYLRCPIILTSLLLIPKELITIFWKSIDPIVPFIKDHSKPLWNGEDIVMCLLSWKYLGKLGYIINNKRETPIRYLNTEEDKSVAISQQNGHHLYRTMLVRKFFEIYRPINNESNN